MLSLDEIQLSYGGRGLDDKSPVFTVLSMSKFGTGIVFLLVPNVLVCLTG